MTTINYKKKNPRSYFRAISSEAIRLPATLKIKEITLLHRKERARLLGSDKNKKQIATSQWPSRENMEVVSQ